MKKSRIIGRLSLNYNFKNSRRINRWRHCRSNFYSRRRRNWVW